MSDSGFDYDVQPFDSVAIRINGPKAAERVTIDWQFTDLTETYRTTLADGVLTHYPNPLGSGADLTLTLTKPQLLAMLAGAGMDDVTHSGDLGTIQRLLDVLDTPDVSFAIVTP